MTRSVTITVVTANIGRGVSTDVARANIERIAERFPGAFVGFQEIDEADGPDEATLLLSRFPSAGGPSHPGPGDGVATAMPGTYAFAGFSGPGWKRATPIAVPSTWSILGQSLKKSSDG